MKPGDRLHQGVAGVAPNCYAETLSGRLRMMGQKKYAGGFAYTERADAARDAAPLEKDAAHIRQQHSAGQSYSTKTDLNLVLACNMARHGGRSIYCVAKVRGKTMPTTRVNVATR